MNRTADYIVVGGGTAGPLIAARLSENPQKQVILIEAGSNKLGWQYQVPAGTAKLIGHPETDWRYPSEPDPTIGGRSPLCPAGKMLGGSSVMNGMVYVRGQRQDFDDWNIPGWTFDELLPFFKKTESFGGTPSAAHGQDGSLAVEPARARHPLAKAFITACEANGFDFRDEYCAGEQEGAFYTLATICRSGLRSSSARSFLANVNKRSNLTVIPDCQANAILFDGNRASGVRTTYQDVNVDFNASKEVIVCCGTYGSPTLLQRSGIGSAEQLSQAGVKVRHDMPAVGQNLREHFSSSISKLVNQPTYNAPMGLKQYLSYGLQYAFRRRGPIATPVVQAMAYGRSTHAENAPDFMLNFIPFCIDYRQSPPALHSEPGVVIGAQVCRPKCRGSLHISSPDPLTPPTINHRLLDDEKDLHILVHALKTSQSIFDSSAMSAHVQKNNNPETVPADDDEWIDYILKTVGPSYHPVGTCRMGLDDDSVVDTELKVRGVTGLRVADASIMPMTPSANTQAAVYMIAEKVSSLIATTR